MRAVAWTNPLGFDNRSPVDSGWTPGAMFADGGPELARAEASWMQREAEQPSTAKAVRDNAVARRRRPRRGEGHRPE